MGYSAEVDLVYGYRLSEEESHRVAVEVYEVLSSWTVGSVTVCSCGDSRIGMNDDEVIFGILLGHGSEYGATKVTRTTPTPQQLEKLDSARQEYNIQCEGKPQLFLVTYVT